MNPVCVVIPAKAGIQGVKNSEQLNACARKRGWFFSVINFGIRFMQRNTLRYCALRMLCRTLLFLMLLFTSLSESAAMIVASVTYWPTYSNAVDACYADYNASSGPKYPSCHPKEALNK